MPVNMVEGYLPNRIEAQSTASNTTWRVLGMAADYASIAACLAAPDTLFGAAQCGPGGWFGQLLLRSENGGADGSPFWFSLNKATAPSNTLTAEFVSGSGQTIVDVPGQLNNLWFQKTTAGDTIIAIGKY